VERYDNLLLIGATAKDSGKTTLCEWVIRKFSAQAAIYGVKVTIYHGEREGMGFSVTEETRSGDEHDTTRMLAAGAHRVFWVRCDRSSVGVALTELFSRIPHDALIVCESNSVRNYLIPRLFIMVTGGEGEPMKQSAREVLPLADIVVTARAGAAGMRYEPDIGSMIAVERGRWTLTPAGPLP
jgi:hypothetical protein